MREVSKEVIEFIAVVGAGAFIASGFYGMWVIAPNSGNPFFGLVNLVGCGLAAIATLDKAAERIEELEKSTGDSDG